MIPLILLTSILNIYPVWESKEIYSTWTPRGQGYEYVLEIYTDRELTEVYMIRPPTTNHFIYTTFTESNLYFQRVKYYLVSNPSQYQYEYLGQFYLNLEHGYYGEDILEFPTYEEEEQPNIPVSQVDAPISSEQKYVIPKSIDYREEILEKDSNVMGLQTVVNSNVCNISIYKKDEEYNNIWDCDIDINISKTKYLDWERFKTLEIEGVYPSSIYANIKVYECKNFTLRDPSTWFKCKYVLVDTVKSNISLIYSGYILVDGKSKNSNFAFYKSSFFLKRTFTEDISKKDIALVLKIYSQIKGKDWIDVNHVYTKNIQVPKLEKVKSNKPFSFPIDRYIGVTQWHGCTKYQCPHKGIDFGARLNKVISVGDGTVVKVGYDKYGGECNQGGNYVIIKHTNGMYSTYFHLKSYFVKVGSTVKKGSSIGISGNSGKWNCQNLGYHLHFETRKKLSSSTHVNPVEYIEVDWNLIPTIGYKQYPKRLSGENPHPNF